jgi:hypothetical protein
MFGKKKETNDCCNVQFEEVKEEGGQKPTQEEKEACCAPGCC